MQMTTPRATLGRGRWKGIGLEAGLVWLGALLGLLLVWQTPQPITIEVGPFAAQGLTNFESPETNPQRDYRWSNGPARIDLPGIGVQTWQATLIAAAGTRPAGPAPLTIRANDAIVLEVPAADPDFHPYTFTIPVAAIPNGDLRLDLDIAAFRPPNDTRNVGLAVDRLTLESPTPRLPAPVPWLALAATLAVLYATVRLGQPWRLALIGTVAAGLIMGGLMVDRLLQVTPYAVPLLIISGLLYSGWVVAQPLLRPVGEHTGAVDGTPSRPAALGPGLPALLGISVVGYALFNFATYLTTLLLTPSSSQDFTNYYTAARRMLAGQPLYEVARLAQEPFYLYKYPPFFALLLEPVARLPVPTAFTIWTVVNLGFLAVALGALLRAHQRSLRTGAPAALALLVLLLLFDPLRETLSSGQMEVVLLGLLALTWAALRRGHPAWAGIPLALAILLKLYPGVLLLYLLLRREWRALASCALTTAALVGGNVLLTGVAPWETFVTTVLPHSGGVTAWIENQTFAGWLARLLTDKIALEAFPTNPPGPALLLTVATVLWAGLILAIATAIAWRPAARTSAAYALGFASFTISSVLVLPAAWYHYLTLMILPLGILFFVLEDAGPQWWQPARPADRWGLLAIAAATALLTFGTYWVVWPGANPGGPWKLVLSYKFYGMVLLWLGCLWLARRTAHPAAPPPALVPEDIARQ